MKSTYSNVRVSDANDKVDSEAEIPNGSCATFAPMITAADDEYTMSADCDEFLPEWIWYVDEL